MEFLETHMPQITTAIVLIGTLAGLIVNYIKARKNATSATNKLSLLEYIESAIDTIDNVFDMTEDEKVAYIKDKLTGFVADNNLTSEAMQMESMLTHIIKFFYELQPSTTDSEQADDSTTNEVTSDDTMQENTALPDTQ